MAWYLFDARFGMVWYLYEYLAPYHILQQYAKTYHTLPFALLSTIAFGVNLFILSTLRVLKLFLAL